MHLPDGFINPGVAAGLAGASVGFLAAAWSKVRAELTAKVPVLEPALLTNTGQSVRRGAEWLNQKTEQLGLLAALVFAAQMVNFPVTGGTSGHLIGAALLVVAAGPWAAMIGLAAVVTVQALLFADGGLIALGPNLFNMAVVAPLVAYGVWRLADRRLKLPRWLGVTLAAWASVVVASLTVAVELAISGQAGFAEATRAMVSVHSLIGLGEAAVTLLLLKLFVPQTAPVREAGEANAESYE
jgi:cobalt/nickel transport system permease protein